MEGGRAAVVGTVGRGPSDEPSSLHKFHNPSPSQDDAPPFPQSGTATRQQFYADLNGWITADANLWRARLCSLLRRPSRPACPQYP